MGVVILGATSAIARAAAAEFAGRGHALVLGARDQVENEAIAADLRTRYRVAVHPLSFDAADFAAHGDFAARCDELLGAELEGVVLVAGFMDDQARAQADFEIARRTIDVNYTGAVSILERFAAILERRGKGWICGVSSVAGDRGRMSNYIYGSSKAALTVYLAGLRNRLQHKGVHVLTVKPGFVDTKMTYGEVPFAMDPKAAGAAIARAVAKRKSIVYIPWLWRYIMLIIRHIPEPIFKRMKM